MRAVILADRSMAVREREMLARLELGLVGEGVRVVHAIPTECIDAEPIGLYSTPIAYENGWSWTRAARVQRLAERLRKAFDADNVRCVDVVHVFAASGDKAEPGEAWAIADELATLTGARLLVEVVSAAQVKAAPAFARSCRRANPGDTPIVQQSGFGARPVPGVLGFACPDEAVLRALAPKVKTAAAFLTPWGVHAEDDALAAVDAERANRSVGVLAVSKGRGLTSAIEALAMLAVRRASAGDAASSSPGLMIFVGAEDERAAGGGGGGVAAYVWKLGRKLGILNHLTLIPAMEARRDPVMDLDALILTDCAGVHRSLTLDAMASGVAVVAPPDPLVDDLDHGVTCRIVPKPTHSAWLNTLESVLYDAPARQALLTSAWAYVQRERSASTHIAGVAGAYAALVGEEAAVS